MKMNGIELGLVLVLVTMLCHEAAAQSSCTAVLIGLSPCLNYITGNSSTPSSSCCTQLANVVQSQPKCLCSALNGGSSLGITVNQTLATSLPGACNVQTPPVSSCNAANGPASAPTSPPADTSDDTPDASTKTPSNPSGTGSKTTTKGNIGGGTISSGSNNRMPVPLTFFILFLVSCFSRATII